MRDAGEPMPGTRPLAAPSSDRGSGLAVFVPRTPPSRNGADLDLAALVAAAAPEELWALIGQLEEAKARAIARLIAPTSASPAVPLARGDRLLSMPQVAERLGLSLYTVRERGRRGELPVVKVGRRVGVREESLRRFIDQRERGKA